MVNYSEMHNHLLRIHEFIESEYKILPNSRLKIIEEAIDWGSLAKGGLIGGAIALIAWIINFFVKKNKENKEKTKETPQTKEAKEKKINENVETYKKKIEELKKELEDYKKDHPEEGSNAQKVIEYVSGGTTTIEVSKPEDQERIKNLTQEKDKLTEENKTLAEEIKSLKDLGNNAEELNKRIAELEESLEDAKQKNALAQKNWADQQAEANDAREESENLKEQLKEKENKIQELQTQLSNSTQNQSSINNLQQEIQKLKNEKDQLNKKLSDNQNTINQLQAQNTNNSNQEEFDKLQKRNEDLKEEQKKLKEKNTKLDTELTSYKDRETDRQRTVNSMKERLENLEKTVGNDPKFKSDIEALKQQYSEYYAKNQQLSRTLNIKEIPEIITGFLKNIPQTFPDLILSNTSQYNLDNTDKFYSENKDVAKTYNNPDICISGTYMICTFLRLLGSLHLTFKITGNDFQAQNSSNIREYIQNYFDNKIFIKKDINLKTNIFSFQFVENSEPKIATVIEQFKKLKIFEKIKDLSKLSYDTLFQNYNDLRNTASSEELKIVEGILKNEAYNLYINTITKPNEKSNAFKISNSSNKTSYNYEELANTIKNYSSQFAKLCVIEGKWKDYQNKFDNILNKKVEVSNSLVQGIDQTIKDLNKKTTVQKPENLQKPINSKSNNTSNFSEEKFKQKALDAINENNLEETNKNIQNLFQTHPYYIKKCQLLDKIKDLFGDDYFNYEKEIPSLNEIMMSNFKSEFDDRYRSKLIFSKKNLEFTREHIIYIFQKQNNLEKMIELSKSLEPIYKEFIKLYCDVNNYTCNIEKPQIHQLPDSRCITHIKSANLILKSRTVYWFIPYVEINKNSYVKDYEGLIFIEK